VKIHIEIHLRPGEGAGEAIRRELDDLALEFPRSVGLPGDSYFEIVRAGSVPAADMVLATYNTTGYADGDVRIVIRRRTEVPK
jgi:hypothetical protein